VIAGITDQAASRFGLPSPDIDAALAGVSEEMTVIPFSHWSGVAAEHARAGVDLQLSGHTHGGQVLTLDQIVRSANGYVAGKHAVESMQLYMSNSAGLCDGFPVRLGRPSKITQITLISVGKG